jgi:hypothetical protein
VASRPGARPAGHRRPLASKGLPPLVGPSAAAAGQTTDRGNLSRPDPPNGRREPVLGAPRIHGELLKLGIAVSERTVSRYLPHSRRAPSQSWRTFLTNHLGQLSFVSLALPAYASEADDVVHLPSVPVGHMPSLCDGLSTSHLCALVDSSPRTSRMPTVRDHRLNRTARRRIGGRDPPACCRSIRSTGRVDGCSCVKSLARNDCAMTVWFPRARESAGLISVSVEHQSRSPGRQGFVDYSAACVDSDGGGNIGEPQA